MPIEQLLYEIYPVYVTSIGLAFICEFLNQLGRNCSEILLNVE